MSSGTWIASHNANAFFPEYLSRPRSTFRPSLRTLSNAMDVGAPSNFERLEHLLEHRQLTRMISGYSISDSETIRSIRKVYETTGYLADPHTAVAFRAVERHRKASGLHKPTIIVSTAHPAKFGDTVEEAVGFRPDIPHGLAKMEGERTAVRDLKSSQGTFNDAIGRL
jgi:threonine synthase